MASRARWVPLALAMLALAPLAAGADSAPQFQLGFRDLAGLIPEVVGEPLEDEHHNPLNGDGLQQTTTGLMVWRKADNWTAFTDGYWTWVNGPLGLQDRRNEERFPWEEAQPAGEPPEEPSGLEAADPGLAVPEGDPLSETTPRFLQPWGPPPLSPTPRADGTPEPWPLATPSPEG